MEKGISVIFEIITTIAHGIKIRTSSPTTQLVVTVNLRSIAAVMLVGLFPAPGVASDPAIWATKLLCL